MANPYTPEAAQQRYPGQASLNAQRPARTPWRASGASKPRPQQNAGGNQAAPPGPQKAPDMSRYASPGQAQPIQPQSQGTPYGAQPDGNYAYATPENRPAPFTQRFTNFDGTVSEQPDFGRRDAFIQNINDSMLPYYGGQSQGAPQFDFQSMWGKAGDMVSNGWQNPFAMPAQPQQPSLEQQLAQYAPQTQYQPAQQPQLTPADTRPYGFNGNSRPSNYLPPESSPLTWTEQQWAEYAANPSPFADSGGYFRKDGKVFRSYGLGGTEELLPGAERDANGNWNNPRPQPTSMPADPYAQVRPDDYGFMYPNPAGPQPTGGEWRPTHRSPWAPLAFYPDGSDTPDLSYGTRPGQMQRPGA